MKNALNISCEQDKKEFLDILEKYIGKEAGYDTLKRYLLSTDFFTAPADTTGPLACAGGLVKHALNVYDRFLVNLSNEANLSSMPKEKTQKYMRSGAICTLLGDISNVANLGYGDPDDPGVESVYILNSFIKLCRNEAFAIRFHKKRNLDKEHVRTALKNEFVYLVYKANLDATFLDEVEGG